MPVSLIRNIVFSTQLTAPEIFGKTDVRVTEMNSSEVLP